MNDYHDFKQLYDYEPYQRTSTTQVVASEALHKADPDSGAKYRIRLKTAETIFYPEGGGQPGDTGTITLEDGSQIQVLDTRYDLVDDEAYIFHYTDSPAPEQAEVKLDIDWERRFTHMQQHSAEHILSGLVHSTYGYMNVGFHLGREYTTIDFDGPVSYEEMQEIVYRANQVVWANNTITPVVYTADEAKKIKFRTKIELDNLVRLIEIPGADICACSGTHVAATGDIGMILCTKVESYKGGSRIYFYAGTRAYSYVREHQEIINELVVHQNSPAEELLESVKRLDKRISELESQIESTANSIWAKTMANLDSPAVIHITEDIFSTKILRRLFKSLDEEARILVLMSQEDSFSFYLREPNDIYNSPSSVFNLLKLKYLARGGGGPDLTQGQIPLDNIASSKIFPKQLAMELEAKCITI